MLLQASEALAAVRAELNACPGLTQTKAACIVLRLSRQLLSPTQRLAVELNPECLID
jgi:hypothetical protein